MKLRPMTLGVWAELFFGAILPTILVEPILVSLVVGLQISQGNFLFRVMTSFIVVGAVISFWLLILFGPEQIRQRPILRWFSILIGISGLVVCLSIFVLLFFMGSFYETKFSGHKIPWGTLLFNVVPMVGLIVVWLRYFLRLLKKGSMGSAES